MPPRRRLSPGERRAELLAVGAREFAAKAYDDVQMDEVAIEAGVSRALLYKYFAGKAELFAGVYQAAADQLLESSPVDPSLPLRSQVEQGLDAHLDYFEANAHTVVAANRTLAGDPTIQAIIEGELDVLRQRLLDASPVDPATREALSAVLMAWLVFVRVLVVSWLVERQDAGAGSPYSREQVRDICTGALLGALMSVPGLDLPA